MLPKIILGIGIFATLFSILIFSGKIQIGTTKKLSGQVSIWGTFPNDEMQPIVEAYSRQVKTYKVTYREVREENFNQALLEGLANRYAPDIILAPYQTILAQSSRILPYAIDKQKFEKAYINGASVFYGQSSTLALPVSVEPMVLFYNRTLLSKRGIANPPEYWGQLASMVPNLTIQNGRNQFTESGIALGAPNTPYAKDILMTMVRQMGQVPVLQVNDSSTGYSSMNVIANTPTTRAIDVYPLSDAVRYFTQFAVTTQKTYTWNQFAGNADDQFVAEKLAMYIGYSGELGTLRERNPRAEISMTTLPQKEKYNTFVTGMRMYGVALLRSTNNYEAALEVQRQFSGVGIDQSKLDKPSLDLLVSSMPATLASIVGGVPAFRNYGRVDGVSSVIASSVLVAEGWNDTFKDNSTAYITTMISDILNNRQSLTEAVDAFINHMQDLYTPLN